MVEVKAWQRKQVGEYLQKAWNTARAYGMPSNVLSCIEEAQGALAKSDPNDGHAPATSRCDHGVPMSEPCEKCGPAPKFTIMVSRPAMKPGAVVKQTMKFYGKPMLFESAQVAESWAVGHLDITGGISFEVRQATAKQTREGTTDGQ